MGHHDSLDRRRQPLVPRRTVLRAGATGAAALAGLGVAARSLRAQDCTLIPSQTEGPYWVDEMLNRSDIRSDTATGAVQPGLPLRLSINVSEVTSGVCAPMSDIWVDVWHCSALGVYSDVAQQGTVGHDFLRGYQLADAHGNVRFLTIYPGWYPGRTIHIHCRFRRFVNGTPTFNFVTQLYFDQAITAAIHNEVAPYVGHGQPNTTNAMDGIFNAQLLSSAAYNGTHAVANFNAVLNANPGIARAGTTPTDPDAKEHANDFGGGSPVRLA
ncbi:MAG: hypothetical protein KDA22_10495 [Phycisphaerales bacterium]|nr:hypothetical protein [Phycisphaerales bacterium]